MTSKNVEPCLNSVFQRDWWLDAIAPRSWTYLTVGDSNRPQAIWPIVVTKKYGIRQIRMPVLTFILGPGIAPTNGAPAARIGYEMDMIGALLDQLPPFDLLVQNFHFDQKLATPFLWRNFEVSALHTYTIEDLSDQKAVWENYRGSMRTQIRKAQKLVHVERGAPLRDVWSMSEMSFGRRGGKPAYGFELLERLDAACRANNACASYVAKDHHGKLHAGIYVVWDRNSAYYLIGGADPELRTSGATSLLLHEAISDAASVTRRFDFQGCNLEGFEFFKRNFGGTLKTFLQVRGYSRKMRVAQAFQKLLAPPAR